MNKVNIPDPLEAQIEALDKVFYQWLDASDDVQEDKEYWQEQWDYSAHEPFVYTSDEIYEGWGNDIEDFVATNNLAVDKALADEIDRKTNVLKRINESCPYCEDGTCTSQEHGDNE